MSNCHTDSHTHLQLVLLIFIHNNLHLQSHSYWY